MTAADSPAFVTTNQTCTAPRDKGGRFAFVFGLRYQENDTWPALLA